ncbi:unnamed protein product [Parnassius apollo]|uniref:(apollo) hypothetical protein n=1 Tax=Parnassius apollo TaxID=110799 RepID=A0A8S3Y7H4_PARAO|nr:unnamed protein product [Parnassius apollo]
MNNNIFDGEVVDSRYNIFRRDRDDINSSKEDGGGVLIAVKKSFQVLRQAYWDSNLEDLWISIIPKNCNAPKINICVCYLPPELNCFKRDEFFSNCQKILLNHCIDDKNIIVGDFNTPEYSPVSSDTDGPSFTSQSKKLLLLQEFMSICNLHQGNRTPNEKGRYLDLVLSSENLLTVTEADTLSLKDGHHPALEFEFPSLCNTPKNLKLNNKKRLNFARCDYDSIRHDLELLDWHNLLSSSDVDECVNIFYEQLFVIINKYTPLTAMRSNKYPVWYSKPLIKCIEEKNKYHKLYKKFNNPRDYDVFTLLRARAKKMIDHCYKNYVASIEESMTDNIKSFWTYVNNRKGRVSIPNVMQFGNSSSSTGQGVCELFSKYFASVFESDQQLSNSSAASNNNLESPECSTMDSISHINISDRDIMTKIKLLDASKGAGPDQIPPSFVKRCGKELCTPLSIIFNKSLTNGVFPISQRLARGVSAVPRQNSGCKGPFVLMAVHDTVPGLGVSRLWTPMLWMMEKKIVRKGPLPGGRQGASGAGAGRDSMRAASRARGVARPPSSPPHPSSPPEGLVSAGSSRTQQAAPAAGGARRMHWSKSMNENALRAYFRPKGEETGCLAYRARMHRFFAELEPSLSVTEQNLADRVRYILRSNIFGDAELERLRREAIPSSNGNATAGNAAPLDAQQTAYVDAAVNIPFVANSDDDGIVSHELEKMRSILEESMLETRSMPLENRPRLPRIPLSKRNRAVVRALNPMLVTYLEASRDLCETDSILFGATLAVCRIIGAKLPVAGRATQKSSAIPAWIKKN